MPATPHLNAEAVELIKRLGGNSKTAELCEVSPSAVSQWTHHGIPRQQMKFLRLARPDVFTEDASGGSSNSVKFN